MNFRRILIFGISALLLAGSAGDLEAYGAKRSRSKARTSQSYKKKKKRRYSSGTLRHTKRKATPRKQSTPPAEVPQTDSLTMAVNRSVLDAIPADQNPGGLRVNAAKPDMTRRNVKLSLNENFTYLPVSRELISKISDSARRALPDSLSGFDIQLSVGQRSLAYYINKIDPLPAEYRVNIPFVSVMKPYVEPKHGMEGDIIALWHSHGRYYKNGAWQWQRPLLFQSIEDTYTMGYVLPYLVPMLENAGAYVLLPRERCINRNEVIVDNDTNDEGMLFSQTGYREMNGSRSWKTGEGEGFIYDLPDFRDTENPFENGTYRQIETITGGKPAVAAWYADIPEEGEYAVYVSYESLPESTRDARYTVNYSGGSREFKVNQQMGGSTWVYLGTFPFEAGYSESIPVVTLTNISDTPGAILTADAIKIGGGMGNIARSPRRSDVYQDPSTPIEEEEESDEESDEEALIADEDESPDAEPTPTPAPAPSHSTANFRTSGLPRYLEGARYWLQWAGAPEGVYSPYHGANDYKDDYTSRGEWVNWLAGGSRVLPRAKGLNIPVDMAFALHSDAGKKSDDSFVGTLGIYYSNNGDSYRDGTARINSRMLTDLIMRQISGDVRRLYEPDWKRRQMWDKSYVEARVPEVPTTLIELMSHQNFADMQYGLDPGFKFTVSRAIYKGMARFMAERKKREVVIQPLPVKNFAIQKTRKRHYRLSWQPVDDPLEPTAKPTKYIIMERTEEHLGFVKVGETTSTHFDIKVDDDLIRSFRVIAANSGGLSFPSETLSMRAAEGDKPLVLIVNGFTRVSGPEHFTDEGRAGFDSSKDFGVPYIREISYTGPQTEFRRGAGESFGRSSASHIGMAVAGNTFDFPFVHGEGIADAGYGFVSCSAAAVEGGAVNLSDYKIVDLILGRQKTTTVGRGHSGRRYEAIPKRLQADLESYVADGGRLIVSGEKTLSDLTDYRNSSEGAAFAANVLGIEKAEGDGSSSPTAEIRSGSLPGMAARRLKYSDRLNEKQYAVQYPDRLQPSKEGAYSFLDFSDGSSAGILSRYGKGRVAMMSIPIEAVSDLDTRLDLIEALLKALEK